MSDVKTMNIYQRMAEVTSALAPVAKNLTIKKTEKSSYKAVAEFDVLEAVKPLEYKYGIYSFPVSREVIESHLIENKSTYKDNRNDTETVTVKTSYMSRIKTIYRFVNIDNPSEYAETITFAEGIDSADKGSGKAMTYCDKYALMKAYKISTADDVESLPGKIGDIEIEAIKKVQEKYGLDNDKMLSYYKIKDNSEMTTDQYADYMARTKELDKVHPIKAPQTVKYKEVEQLSNINSMIGGNEK